MGDTIKTKDKESGYIDVTDEWLKNATPNSHKVKDRNYFVSDDGIKYYVDEKNVVLDYSVEERKVAEWFKKTFGGEIYMNPRINYPQMISTADYTWEGEQWDLKGMKKSISLSRTVDNVIKNSKCQSNNFILDITKCKLDDETIINQVKGIFSNGKFSRNWVKTIIIKRNDNLIKVYKKIEKEVHPSPNGQG